MTLGNGRATVIMASISSYSSGSIQQATAIRHYQQRRRRQNDFDGMLHQQQDVAEEHRRMHQRQLQEEQYNRSIASPGSSSGRMSRQQLVQRRLERRRLERRQRTNHDLQISQTTPMRSQQNVQPTPIHQPPPPGTSPRSIMKKSSSYQNMRDQQYFHNQQQHNSSGYSTDDSSSNFVSPPMMNRKQISDHHVDETSDHNNNTRQVFTQNGVVIDRNAFRPRNRGGRGPRLHESPSDEWTKNGNQISHHRRALPQQNQYHEQYQHHPQIYVPDTPSTQNSQNSEPYNQRSQMRGRSNERYQPNWQELDQQRFLYQKQLAARHRRQMVQQKQHVNYVSDDEGNKADNDVSFNSQSKTPTMKHNRSRSLSRERQLPRRWRHKTASVGKEGTSELSVNTGMESPHQQFEYTPRSRLAVSESLGQSEVNTPVSSHSRNYHPPHNDRHGWRQHNSQQQQQNHWGRRGRQNLVSPSRSEPSPHNQEAGSVASIKQSWEGRINPTSPQRGRQRDNSRRSNGENPFCVWEERESRVSKLRQEEQRREQQRSMESKWRRNASLPPPERPRRQLFRQEEYSAGYQSDGGYRSESLERRRGQEWRQEDYYDGYQSDGGYRSEPNNRRVDVDAAHVTMNDARRRLWDQDERLRTALPQSESYDSVGDVRNRPLPSIGLASPGNVSTLSTGSALFKSKFIHAAALATQKRNPQAHEGQQKSLHYPIKEGEEESPRGSSQITDSTADTTAPSSNHTSHEGNSHFQKQPVQPNPTMPPIAEAPQASVADLIARINAVSRDNPAEALARIDSILKRENVGEVGKPHQDQNQGVATLFNFDSVKKQQVSNKRRNKEDIVASRPQAPPPHEKMSNFEDDADHNHDDPSIADSLLSSGESTVSSMTNPTYQDANERRRKKSPTNHPPTKSIDRKRDNSSPRQETKPNRSGDDGPLTKAKLQSFNMDNKWSSSLQSDFFNDYGGTRTSSSQAVAPRTRQAQRSSAAPSEPKAAPKRPATPELMTAVSSAFSDVNISFGDEGTSQDLLAKAFSDVGDTGRATNVSRTVVSNAFSNVDISMEPKKTVSQHRQELEMLSKSWAGTESEDYVTNQQQNPYNALGWTSEESKKSPKQKKKMEPTLRLKGNKKLTQKFANLVKAFEY